MNRINRKLLLISLGVLAVLGIGLFLVNRYQVSRQGDFYFARAREARDAGNLSGAIAQYRQAIRLGKKDFEVYSELADTLFKINDYKASQMAALRAEQLQRGDEANQRILAESSLMLGESTDVLQWTDKLLAKSPGDPELLVLRGRAKAQTRDFASAAEEYEQALKSPLAPVSAYDELATLYADYIKLFDKGREVIDRLLVGPEVSVERLVAHGEWYVNRYARRSISSRLDEQEAVKELLTISQKDAQEALTKFPEEPTSYILAMRVANTGSRLDETLSLAAHAIPRFPQERELYALAASAASEAKQQDLAGKYLQQGLRQFPSDSGLLWELANLQLETKDLDAGRGTLKKLLLTNMPKPQTRFLNARFLTAEGNFQEAIKEYEATRSEMIDSPEFQRIVDIELARCYEGIADRPGQIQILRRAVSQNSGWLAAREQLAMALLAAGRVDEATEEYTAIARNNDLASLNLARLMVIQNISREESRRDWKPVDAILDEIEKKIGLQNDLAIVRAESLLARDRIDEAKQVLEQLQPSDSTYAARILLEVNQRSWYEADRLIADAQSQGFDSVELRRAQAIRAVLGEVPSMGETLSDLARAPETWSAAQVLELQKELLPIAASGNLDEMVQKLGDAILSKDPANLNSRFEILELQRRNKDRAGMQRTLAEVEKISRQNAIWNYGQAIALVVDPDQATPDDYERAQQYLNQASILRPDWADVQALSGALYDKMNNAEAAIPKYEQAVKLGWKRLETAQRVLKLLIDRGRFSEADDMIRRLSQSSPALSSQMSRAASEISWKLDNLTRAVEKAEEAAKASQSVGDFLWLSQIKQISKDVAGAEAALKTAIEQYPSDSRVLVAWIGFLSDSKRLDEARASALQLESQIDSGDALQTLTLAEIFTMLKMSAESARATSKIDASKLQTASDHERYYRLKNAESREVRSDYLKTLVAREGNSEDPSVLMWARRQLAILALNQPKGPDYEAATELLESNMKTPLLPTSEDSKRIEDRRLLALISAATVGSQDPSASLQKFEELLRDGWTPNANDLFLLGRLHLANKDWTRGSRYFVQLLNRSEGRDPNYIKYYVERLLDRNDPREAELWLDVLRRDRVQDIETAELLAKIRFRRGQFDDLLRDLVGEETKYPETEWFQATVPLRRRFELLNEYLTKLTKLKESDPDRDYTSFIDQFAEASEKMSETLKVAGDFPGARYALQLLDRGEVAKAITALELVIESTSTDEVAGFVQTIVAAPNVPADQLDRLEQIISKLDPPADASAYEVAVARLKETRGDNTGAERIYRDILAKNPKDAVVLNNLANLMALKGQNLNEALDMINQSIEIEGKIAMLLDTRGVVHLKAGNTKEAVEDLEEAVRQFPHPLLRYHLAWAYFESNQSAKAKLQLKAAFATNPPLEESMTHILEHPIYKKLMNELMKEEKELSVGSRR